MIKKQIKNLNRAFATYVKLLFLAVIIAGAFIPLVPVVAQTPTPIPNQTPPITPQGPSTTCNISTSDLINPVLRLSKAKVGYEETFDSYYEGKLNAAKTAECKAGGGNDYEVAVFVYSGDGGGGCSGSAVYNLRKSYKVSFVEENGVGVLRTRINNLSLKSIFTGTTVDDAGDKNCVYFYLHPKNTTTYRGYVEWNGQIKVNGAWPFNADGYFDKVASAPNAVTDTLPTIAETQDGSSTTVDNTKSILASTIAMSFTKSENGAGLRDKYRVVATDPDMVFGTMGLDAVTLDWASGGPKIGYNQYIAISQRNDYTLIPQQDPQFKYVNVYFADGTATWSGNKSCEGGLVANDGCDKLVYTTPNALKGEGDTSASSRNGLTNPYKPTLKAAAWAEFKDKTAAEGKSVGSTSFYVIPILWGETGITAAKHAYVIGKTPPKFTVEVFAKEEDIIAACKAETENDNLCTASYSRFGIGKVLETTTASSETDAKTATQTLYEFILSVISSIVIFLTSQIYRIFAYFVVPVINGLLGVKPYQDAFVNIIYPGWLILRNLSNIFFIIALLVVGLKILFQQSAAGTAATFIRRLVLMALLVNFSLVISQGVVGIADTVQSQFLPANTKVIEALGTKLMVEPIISFRFAVGGGSETGEISGTANVADLTKPIVLLILAVAAFFAFLAIGAFLTVRLVALMLLYMTSPIAYVGYVMDETRGYSSKWWKEFIKYAFITPILVFFLNIAALVATVTSSTNGTVIKLDDNLESGIIAGGLTIASHFIVLVIIFAGMKYAMGSGVAGANTIVKYAKKGFENTFKKPGAAALGLGKWAKNAAGDSLSEAAQKRGYGKTAAAISALTQPAITGKALKGKFFDEPKKKQMERLAQKRTGLEQFVSNVGNNKWQATKMAAWKLRNKGAAYLRNEADELNKIKTDQQIKDDTEEIRLSKGRLQNVNSRLSNPNNKYVTKRQAEVYLASSEDSIKNLTKERDAKLNDLTKEKGAAYASGSQARINAVEKDIRDTEAKFATDIKNEELSKKFVESALSALPKNAGDSQPIEMPIPAGAQVVLNANAAKINGDIEKLEAGISEDASLRKLHGLEGEAVDDRRKEILGKQADELLSMAAKREFPNTPGDVSTRLGKENEEGKKYDGIDDPDTLNIAFEEALKKNNMAAAAAIAKKISKEGGFADLLKAAGKNNNVEDFKKFMDEKFKGAPVVVRNQIASEISYLNGQNGNRALANATSIDENRVVKFNTVDQQQKKIEKSAGKKSLWERKKGDLTYQDNTGKNKFNAGEFEAIDKISSQALKELEKRVKPDVAEHILKTAKEQGKKFTRTEVEDALNRTAYPAGAPTTP